MSAALAERKRKAIARKDRLRREARSSAKKQAEALTWHFYVYSGTRCLSGTVEAPSEKQAKKRARLFVTKLSGLLWSAAREKGFADCWVSIGIHDPVLVVVEKEES